MSSSLLRNAEVSFITVNLEFNESKPHSHTSFLALLHAGFADYGTGTKVRPGRSVVRIPRG
jgi:hypothetical protein